MQVPLHDAHRQLGARFVEFGGFEMPLLYTSILEEHEAVRTRAGLFDVSHMSNVWLRGRDATRLLSETVASNPARIQPGQACYTVALREDGTIIDDLIFYKFSDEEYHVVPNAGMNRILTSWFEAHASRSVTVEDVSREYCILAVQGPRARDVLSRFYPADVAGTQKFRFTQLNFGRRKGFASGTGYTGEDGLELVVPNEEGLRLFPEIVSRSGDLGLVPCGLGARDTLRLEKGYCLAPHEFAGGRSPLEAGLGWVVHWDHAFVGRHALEIQKAEGKHARLVGLRATGPGIPRQECPIYNGGGKTGVVTSGTMSPTLKVGIALGYVRPEHAAQGQRLSIDVRSHPLPSLVSKLPFV